MFIHQSIKGPRDFNTNLVRFLYTLVYVMSKLDSENNIKKMHNFRNLYPTREIHNIELKIDYVNYYHARSPSWIRALSSLNRANIWKSDPKTILKKIYIYNL